MEPSASPILNAFSAFQTGTNGIKEPENPIFEPRNTASQVSVVDVSSQITPLTGVYRARNTVLPARVREEIVLCMFNEVVKMGRQDRIASKAAENGSQHLEGQSPTRFMRAMRIWKYLTPILGRFTHRGSLYTASMTSVVYETNKGLRRTFVNTRTGSGHKRAN